MADIAQSGARYVLVRFTEAECADPDVRAAVAWTMSLGGDEVDWASTSRQFDELLVILHGSKDWLGHADTWRETFEDCLRELRSGAMNVAALQGTWRFTP